MQHNPTCGALPPRCNPRFMEPWCKHAGSTHGQSTATEIPPGKSSSCWEEEVSKMPVVWYGGETEEHFLLTCSATMKKRFQFLENWCHLILQTGVPVPKYFQGLTGLILTPATLVDEELVPAFEQLSRWLIVKINNERFECIATVKRSKYIFFSKQKCQYSNIFIFCLILTLVKRPGSSRQDRRELQEDVRSKYSMTPHQGAALLWLSVRHSVFLRCIVC